MILDPIYFACTLIFSLFAFAAAVQFGRGAWKLCKNEQGHVVVQERQRDGTYR